MEDLPSCQPLSSTCRSLGTQHPPCTTQSLDFMGQMTETIARTSAQSALVPRQTSLMERKSAVLGTPTQLEPIEHLISQSSVTSLAPIVHHKLNRSSIVITRASSTMAIQVLYSAIT